MTATLRELPVQQSALHTRIADLYELGKPRLTYLVLFTVVAGGAFAWLVMSRSSRLAAVPILQLLHCVIGVGLCSAGAAALNQYLERDLDARMERTKDRPLPAGRMNPGHVLLYGVSLAIVGVLYLQFLVHAPAGFLGAVTVAIYVFAYTPLKRHSSLNTIVGAVVGAMPPLIGWVAVTGRVDGGAWILFAILFTWQIPHFLAIAWYYKEDYSRAGMQMLPVVDPHGAITMRQMLMYSLLLLPVSLLPAQHGLAGELYLYTALVLSTVFCGFALALMLSRSKVSARRLFLYSLVYLPSLLGVLLLDRML